MRARRHVEGGVPQQPAAPSAAASSLSPHPGSASRPPAVRRCAGGGLSIWDALIIEAARESGAAVLYTEDARLLRSVIPEADGLRVVDPFATADEEAYRDL